MHARELVELSALLATHPAVSEDICVTDALTAPLYWTASKCRLDHWFHTLKKLRSEKNHDDWGEVRALMEEIFASEVLTRIWSPLAEQADRLRGVSEFGPVAQSVFLGHLEARKRALTFLVSGANVPANEAAVLDRLRRRSERWTDMLLGCLEVPFPVFDVGFNPARVSAFAQEMQECRRAGDTAACRLLLSVLRSTFSKVISPLAPNGELNERIAAGVLACFHWDSFRLTDLPSSIWWMRLQRATERIEDLLAELRRECCEGTPV